MSRTFVIADLHGRFDLLEVAYVMFIERRQPGDKFVSLGDFVDRGPDSMKVVDLLRTLQRHDPDRYKVLRGNHEDIMLAALRDPNRYMGWWWGNGGGATLRSYGAVSETEPGKVDIDCTQVPIHHRHWLSTLPYVYEDQHRIYVHAGIPWDKSVDETSDETKTWMLYDYDDKDVEWHAQDGKHVSGKHLVHGHHQDLNHPLLLAGRTDLDSFAWYSGRLAIGVFDDSKPGGPTEILWAEGARLYG